MDDDGFVLWESRAIASYLVRQYAEDDSLYPKNPQLKALVDQRLYFDATTLWPRIRAITVWNFFDFYKFIYFIFIVWCVVFGREDYF